MLCAATCQQYHSSGQRDHITDHTGTHRDHSSAGHPNDHRSRTYPFKLLQPPAKRFNLLRFASSCSDRI
jgi:hypothetical protein